MIANSPHDHESLRRTLDTQVDVHSVNGTKIALETVGKPLANTAMLGALIKVSKVVELESILTELRSKLKGKLPEKVVEKNVQSVERAYQEVD